MNTFKANDNDESHQSNNLNDFYSNKYATMRWLTQHFETQQSLENIDHSIERLLCKTKSKLNFADSTKLRLQQSYDSFESIQIISADQEVDKDLNESISRRELLSTKYTQCNQCQRKILLCSHYDHGLVCRGLESHARLDGNGMKQRNHEMIISVRPHPIRNLRLVGKSYDAILLAWDSPVFLGGENLIEYEISYSCESPNAPAQRKRYQIPCQRWCKREPYSDQTFVLDGLVASTSYSDIRMRCRSRVGWSEYSEAIAHLTTLDPVHPLPPQRFEVNDINCHSITFSWSPPFHNGGVPIMVYNLSFYQSSPVYNQNAGKLTKKVMMQKRNIKIDKDTTIYTISGLHGDTTLQEISLTVTNKFGLQSKPVFCENTKTIEPSKDQLIREEISRICASTETEIDSDFFQPGTLQRMDKQAYLNKLKALLGGTTVHDEQKLSIDNDMLCNTQNQSSDLLKKSFHDSNRCVRRRENYKFRIRQLEQNIEDDEKTYDDLKRNRIILVQSIQQEQERIYLLQSELNRLVTSIQPYSTTNILNGSRQEMKTEDLKIKVEQEIHQKMVTISSLKGDVVFNDKEVMRIERIINMNKIHLNNRLSSFNAFQKQTLSTSETKIFKSTNEILDIVMSSWLQWTIYLKQQRDAVTRIFSIVIKYILREVMGIWFRNITQKPLIASEVNQSQLFCKGSKMLAKALDKRKLICDEIKVALFNNKQLNTSTLPQTCMLDLSILPQKVALVLSRGDYCYNMEKFEDAIEIYIHMLDEIGDNLVKMKSSIQHLYCVLKVKVSCAYINIGSWNNAILHLDGILRKIKIIKIPEFLSTAQILLGKCYLESGDIQLAKYNFLDALTLFERSSDELLLSILYEGLQRLYETINDSERSLHYQTLLKSLDNNKVRVKLNSALQKLNDVEAQLKHSVLKEGETIHFQNATFAFTENTSKIKKLQQSFDKTSNEKEVCIKKIESLHKLIDRIDKEIEKCILSGDSMQTSSLVHDNDQKIKTIELIERLEARKDASSQQLRDEMHREAEMSTLLKNLKDNIQSHEYDLMLDQSQLMKLVLKKRTIRCMAFNEMNKIGVDVFGRRCGGSQYIVLTHDKDLYVYDLLNGNLVHVFVGDENCTTNKASEGHTAAVTCVFFYGDKIYSGSKDSTIRCWNVNEQSLKFVAVGHTGTVTSICVDDRIMVTGSVDKTVILWDAYEGSMNYRAFTHSCGVSSIHCQSSWCSSGDIHGEIFLWKLEKETDKKLSRKLRLQESNKIKVTVIKSSQLELICGDAEGFITIYWLESGEVLRKEKIHQKRITDLQFDATTLVSCSTDMYIKVIDITTCQVLQTIMAHGSPISICYDRMFLLSLEADGTLKQWFWQSQYEHEQVDKYHNFAEGDSLEKISIQYGVRIKDLLDWNRKRDLKNLHPGQKLIIMRGNRKIEGGQTFEYINTDINNFTKSKHKPTMDRVNMNEGILSSRHELTSLSSRLRRYTCLNK